MIVDFAAEIQKLTLEERRKAPRAWAANGAGVRVKVIDPDWLKARAAKSALEAMIANVRQRITAETEAQWSARATAYRVAVKDMQVPCCHRASTAIHTAILMAAGARGFTVSQVRSPSRERALTSCRQEIMWLLSTDFGLSYAQIGSLLGDRDHSTVIHGVRTHASRSAKQEVA